LLIDDEWNDEINELDDEDLPDPAPTLPANGTAMARRCTGVVVVCVGVSGKRVNDPSKDTFVSDK
jgi:hypothetical protein